VRYVLRKTDVLEGEEMTQDLPSSHGVFFWEPSGIIRKDGVVHHGLRGWYLEEVEEA
jgi:hypothetical protein